MMAYVLEYNWVPTKAGWPINHEGHEAVLTDFDFGPADARFLSKGLTRDAVLKMKAHLDHRSLSPRVFSVLPSDHGKDAYLVLRFHPDQAKYAALAQLFCS